MKTITPADDASSTQPRKRTKTRPAARRRTLENTYSDLPLRERLKNEIRAAAKGGEPGTWSARKSQLLTLAYQKAGGGYINRHPNSKQKDLTEQSEPESPTTNQKPSSAKKKAGPKAGEQSAPATEAAKKTRKKSE